MKQKSPPRSRKKPPSKPQNRRKTGRDSPFPADGNGIWLYGRHAVAAAIKNPNRTVKRVFATRNGAQWLAEADTGLTEAVEARPEELDQILHQGAVHQGVAALVEPLAKHDIADICAPATPGRPVLILDQITDPQNIGALFRSAAAFGACAVIVQDRRTPPLSDALAKAAAGAIEAIPCIEVVNIARAINTLQEMGYFCAGLAGEGATEISALPAAQPLALVMGAEGTGLRPLVAKHCDGLYRIPIAEGIESLNVSNAAAITLYEVARNR
ncbi:23S rRNA (guanosine(2251)-2'-O)-methyltransferase RlmB [Hyphococcus sp. DH-69]|uniref:23S rRNA (guanosine(2251)-2'-O)-methyltransferase RlmB n=1 Tax=Hyphococcus formosus TaxID=3143534 RepID=UPI00398A5476